MAHDHPGRVSFQIDPIYLHPDEDGCPVIAHTLIARCIKMFGDEFCWDITGGTEQDALGVRMTIPALSFRDYLALFAY